MSKVPQTTPPSEGLATFKEAADSMQLSAASFRQWRLRRGIAALRHPTNHKVKLVRINDLPAIAQECLAKERAARLAAPRDPARQPLVDVNALKVRAHGRKKAAQPMLQFSPKLPTQEAIDHVVAAIPSGKRKWVEQWCEVVGMCVNGTWQKYLGTLVGGRAVNSKTDFYDWLAEQKNVSARELRRKVALYRQIKKEAGPNEEKTFRQFAEQLLPKPRSGRESIFAKPGNEWMGITLINFYLNQAQFSTVRAWQMLCEECDAKQKAWKLGHHYDKPTLRQCRIALGNIAKPQAVLSRLGEKAYNDKCSPYISRDPASLRSNDVWVTDQKQVDVRLRGAGEQLGRIWMVSFLDARSSKVMGYWFGTVLSSDMVISAAAVAIGRHGVPKAILMDLGKEFSCTAFSGRFRKIKGETLLREAKGLCQRLGIEAIKAIGRNPQTKPIERWHREAAKFDHRIPGWCGSNTDERPEVLKDFERQHEEWKRGRRDGTPLWTIRQYVQAFVVWVETEWNAAHRGRGRYLQGMTPDECWNTQRPAEGIKRISGAELEMATADHRVLKIARGGQINLTVHGQLFEYQAPELFLRQGEEVEVIISRRSLKEIVVLDRPENGRLLCRAQAKPLLRWGTQTPEDREELRQWLRVRNAAKRAVRQGNAARRVLEAAATPELPDAGREPSRVISSVEFKSRKLASQRTPRTETAEESVKRMLRLQEE